MPAILTAPDDLDALLGDLPGADTSSQWQARDRQDQLTKPPGSLGRLEDAACWLAAFAILMATINIAGGFAVTRRMLEMFRK